MPLPLQLFTYAFSFYVFLPLREFNLAGAYRKLMSKPANFSSQLFGYESKDGDMVSHDANSIYQASSFSPSQDLTLPFVGLRLEFDLPSSSYATMLFRELLYDSEVTHFTV
jgi:tRNA pseudouridine13 synthase